MEEIEEATEIMEERLQEQVVTAVSIFGIEQFCIEN